jgi:hypothetical protein
MQSDSTFSVFPSVAVQIYVGTLAGKVAALCIAVIVRDSARIKYKLMGFMVYF